MQTPYYCRIIKKGISYLVKKKLEKVPKDLECLNFSYNNFKLFFSNFNILLAHLRIRDKFLFKTTFGVILEQLTSWRDFMYTHSYTKV